MKTITDLYNSINKRITNLGLSNHKCSIQSDYDGKEICMISYNGNEVAYFKHKYLGYFILMVKSNGNWLDNGYDYTLGEASRISTKKTWNI